tara:strand:- start:367 stop:558 length:192 start_codon:yes stop_codon:yes gene_type:complete
VQEEAEEVVKTVETQVVAQEEAVMVEVLLMVVVEAVNLEAEAEAQAVEEEVVIVHRVVVALEL